MRRVLVLATSRKTRGGITAVLKLYEQSRMWKDYHCRWIGTHRDGNVLRKVWYLIKGFSEYALSLPFYDIVHIHFSLSGSARRKFFFFKLAKLIGKATVLHLHCGSQIDEIWSSVYQTMFEQCDCGILLSETLRKKIEDRIGQSDKLRVVYNPCPIVDSAMYEKKNYILFSGTLYESKGYRDLIQAFARIAPDYRDWSIVLAGNGEEELAHDLALKQGIADQVKILGWVKDGEKHRVFSEARALCLPSYAEGFPMAVLDAWAYGLPVITTPVGGIPDIAVDGENVLLFSPGDVDTLAEKLEMLMKDVFLRETLAAASRKLASGDFSLNTVTEKVAGIYEELLTKA